MFSKDIFDLVWHNRTTIQETTGIDGFAADDPDDIDRLPNTWESPRRPEAGSMDYG